MIIHAFDLNRPHLTSDSHHEAIEDADGGPLPS